MSDADHQFVDLNIWPQPHTHAIGQITLEWNRIERDFDTLAGLYLETDRPTARLVIGLFGNDSKRHLLEKLIEMKETSSELSEAIGYAIWQFNICRENRNHIAHSIAARADVDHKITLRKPRKQNPLETHEMTLTLEQVRECARQIRRASNYISELTKVVSLTLTSRQVLLAAGDNDEAREPDPLPTLPDRPPKPRKLDSFLHITPNIDPDPPESSQA